MTFKCEPEFNDFFNKVVFMPFVRMFQDEIKRKISDRTRHNTKKNNGVHK